MDDACGGRWFGSDAAHTEIRQNIKCILVLKKQNNK
jgi:hypothetical protein